MRKCGATKQKARHPADVLQPAPYPQANPRGMELRETVDAVTSLGDLVASQLYEDLVSLNRSPALARRGKTHERVVNLANQTVGRPSRRGDGTFGELVPTAIAITESGLLVARGQIANIEIGAETKILAKAMIKQIDRVIGDLIRQVDEFRQNRRPAQSRPVRPISSPLVGRT